MPVLRLKNAGDKTTIKLGDYSAREIELQDVDSFDENAYVLSVEPIGYFDFSPVSSGTDNRSWIISLKQNIPLFDKDFPIDVVFTASTGRPCYLQCNLKLHLILPSSKESNTAMRECECNCGMAAEAGLGCVSFSQNFGQTPWAADAPRGKMFIKEEKPCPRLFSANAIKYRHIMFRQIITPNLSLRNESDLILVSDGCGETTEYLNGYPTGFNSPENGQLRNLLDEQWVEVLPDKTTIYYNAQDYGKVACVILPNGLKMFPSDFGIEKIMNDTSDHISQIYSVADGLMNVIAEGGTTTICWYKPEDVFKSSPDDDYYSVLSNASPAKTFYFYGGVVSPASNSYQFHFVESRDPDHVYQHQWDYCNPGGGLTSSETWTYLRGSGGSIISSTETIVPVQGSTGSSSVNITHFSKTTVVTSGTAALPANASTTSSITTTQIISAGQFGNMMVNSAVNGSSLSSVTQNSSGNGIGKVHASVNLTGNTTTYDYDSCGRVISSSEVGFGGLMEHLVYTYSEELYFFFVDPRPITISRSLGAASNCPFIVTSYTYSDDTDLGRSETVSEILSKTIPGSSGTSETRTTTRIWYPIASDYASCYNRDTPFGYSDGRIKTVQSPDDLMTSYTYGAFVSGNVIIPSDTYGDNIGSGGTMFFSGGTPSFTSSGLEFVGNSVTFSAGAAYTIVSDTAIEVPLSNVLLLDASMNGSCFNGAFTSCVGKTNCTVNSRNIYGNIIKSEQFACVLGGAFVSLGSNTFQYNVTHKQTSASYANGKTTSAAWICTGPTTETDADGIVTNYTYDALKRCVGKTRLSPNGTISESYTLDLEGRAVATITSGGSLTTSASAAYDAEGRMVSSTDPAGLTTTWSYSSDRLTTTETIPGNGTRISVMDSAGNMRSLSGTAVVPEFYSYSFNSTNKLKLTTIHYGTSSSSRWVKTYTDGFGRTVKTERPAFGGGSAVTSNFYNAKGQLVSTTTTGQPAVSYTYDTMGNQTAQILTGGTIQRIQSASTNFVSSGGAVWQVSVQSAFASDTVLSSATIPLVTSQVAKLYPLSLAEEARQIQVDVRGNSAVTIQSFNPESRTHTAAQIIPGVTNIASTVTRDGRQLLTVNLNGGTMAFGYDTLHRPVTETDPRNNTTSRVYNSNGQVVSSVDPASAVTSFAYDNAGRVSQIVNALGGTVSYAYDVQGRKTLESGNATYPVSYGYNSFDEMISYATYRTAGNPDVTSCTYDPATGLLASKTYADGKSNIFAYDSAGNLTMKTQARTNSSNGEHITISAQYNDFNQLVSKTYENDEVVFSGSTYTTPPVSNTYNAWGLLTQTIDAAGTQIRTYNQFSELTEEIYDSPPVTVTYLYDSLGRQNGIIGISGGSTFYETTQTFNASTGQINSAAFASSATFAFGYVPRTNLESSIVSPFYNKSVSYENNRNLPTEIKYETNNANSTLIGNRTYSYDAKGQVLSRIWQGESSTYNDSFSYNTRGELTSAYVGGESYSYGFDSIGNRQSATNVTSGHTIGYSTNNLNQYTLISSGQSSYTQSFDDDGNQTYYHADNENTIHHGAIIYDAENRPIIMENNVEGGKITCAYDAFGRRVYKKTWHHGSDTRITRHIYSGMLLIAEFEANPATPNTFHFDKSFFWDPPQSEATRVLAMKSSSTSNQVAYYTHDLTKNTCEIIYSNANSISHIAHINYDPFGAMRITYVSTDARFFFSSEYFDWETGLYYYIHRYYNPHDGRWLSRDPMGELNSINLYLYCKNNDIKNYDYLGLWLGETHRNITRSAFSAIRLIVKISLENCVIIVNSKINEQLISAVITSNVNTDSGETATQQQYHYCSQMEWTHAEAIINYKIALTDYVNKLNKILNQKGYLNKSNCIDALNTLGRLTHMWQDYYAHGVERDDSWFGAQIGTLRGSPDDIDSTYLPVTFGAMGFRGGHGGFFRLVNPFSHVEPGDRATDAANRRNQAMLFTRYKLIKYLNRWIKKCKCAYVNVVIVISGLFMLSCNINADEVELKLVKTIKSNPTYINFDETENNLILCLIDDEKKVQYQEYNIASQKVTDINNKVPDGVPKLVNKVKFVTEYQLYKKDAYGVHPVDKTELCRSDYFKKMILKKKNPTGYEMIWSMPLGEMQRCDYIFRSDSIFPYLLIEDDEQWMIYDSKDKRLIKTIKNASSVLVHHICLSEFLDKIVSENGIRDIDYATTCFMPKENWEKEVKENRLSLHHLLSFFTFENGFLKNEAEFKFQLLSPYTNYEGLWFLNRNTFGMIISIGTRMRFTGEKRLLLYDFDKNKIIVNKQITPNMCFSPKRFTPDNITLSKNGNYLAYCYDEKVYIYQLDKSSGEN